MNYKDAYYHLFNRITDLTAHLENLQSLHEQMNVPLLLRQMQSESEEICTSAEPLSVHKARRRGGSI